MASFHIIKYPKTKLISLWRSYEVFFLLGGRFGLEFFFEVFARSQLARRPVVAFVVAEVSIKQETQNGDGQQDHKDDHCNNCAVCG